MTIDRRRMTVSSDTDVTVFLIGMRFNSPRRVDRWVPVLMAMPRMLRHLSQDPDSGLLHHELWFGRTTLSLQNWRSPEQLRAFAADASAPHLQPWRDFQRVSREGHVGIWHETYVCSPDRYESFYVNMPEFGLGKALGAIPIGPGLATAKQRLRHTGTQDVDAASAPTPRGGTLEA